MEPISEVKEIVQKLESKLKSAETSGYGKKETFEEFVKPLFESLGWDFATDVSKEESVSQNKADYGFKINDVTRFYLTTVPLDQSLEDRKLIIPLTTFAFNRGVTWGVLTNFRKTRLFMSEARGRTPAHMQFFELSSEEFLSKFEKLSYLTKKSLSLNTLDSDAVYFAKKQKKTPIDQQLLEDLLDHRDRLSKNIIKNNPKLTQEQVSHSVQKILNRFIFIRSCGDRQIEERHLQSSLNQWREEKKKRDLIEYVRNIFSEFRGRYGSSLFEKHICDNLQISNFVLEEVIEGLYQSENKAVRYDFSLISSDILGKMYENYLGTIQRKQDGAYYTPNYISKYIAENTIIPYLSKSNATSIPDLISEHADNIKELESKIHNIKILDPACGTGEFLIRAIDILLEILKAIQNHKEKSGKYSHTGKKKKSESVTYATFDKEIEGQELRTIIQNNIYGVDINEEAIEITQLNLFLKLAISSKQLPDISKNLRVGNSLIDDKSVDPNAFDWKQAFPEEFDIVIGNPPYGAQILESHKQYFKNNYVTAVGRFESYFYFKEKSIRLLDDQGRLGYIVSDTWLTNKQSITLRNFVLDNCCINQIIALSENIFYNATVDPSIIILQKQKLLEKRLENKIKIIVYNKNAKQHDIEKQKFQSSFDVIQNEWNKDSQKLFNIHTQKNDLKIIKHIEEDSILLSLISEMTRGINPYAKSELIKKYGLKKGSEIVEKRIWHANSKISSEYKRELTGKDIGRYSLEPHDNKWIKYGEWLSRPRDPKFFTLSHLLVQRIRNPQLYRRLIATLIDPKYEYYNNSGLTNIIITDKKFKIEYVLAILNSNLLNWYFKNFYRDVNIKPEDLRNLPIKEINTTNKKIIFCMIDSVTQIIKKNEKYVISNIENETKKLENEISKIDNEIDELVYKLYNITEEEKKIIESSL